jgi:hypothetical protein
MNSFMWISPVWTVAAVFLAMLRADSVRITGRVISSYGTPVNETIYMHEVDPPRGRVQERQTVRSDSKGVFTLFAPPNKKYWVWLGADHKTPAKIVKGIAG